MSGGTKFDPTAGRSVSQAVGQQALAGDKIANLGMSPRQQHLNRLWAYFTCSQYDARKVDWDGTERVDPIDHEAIATAGFLPPGFYDAGQTFPLKFRKPTAPYHLVRVIVNRFTGLLFSERRHPTLRCEGDPDTEDYVNALAEAARLWPAMIQARAYGGATGSVAIGFQFYNGKPLIEVHDPRWCRPEFEDRDNLTLSSIEKKYMYPVEAQNPRGGWETVWMWYRRIIDKYSDVTFKPALVGDGEEPNWEEALRVDHNFGFCPVRWVQNVPVLDDIDGEPDCHGVFDISEEIDKLLAQASRGTIANCDPTVHVATDMPMAEVHKGSDNAIKTEKGGTVSYVELNGTGPKAAFESAEVLRKYALEVAQCVLEHPDTTQRTATEVERAYSSMYSKADVMREQYGQRCIIPIVNDMLKVARDNDGKTEVDNEGQAVKSVIMLPPRVIAGKDGNPPQLVPRKLGKNEQAQVGLQWPGYTEPSLNDMKLATEAASGAKSSGLIDAAHASKIVAPYFQVDNVDAMLKKIDQEAEKRRQLAESMMVDKMREMGGGGGLGQK